MLEALMAYAIGTGAVNWYILVSFLAYGRRFLTTCPHGRSFGHVLTVIFVSLKAFWPTDAHTHPGV